MALELLVSPKNLSLENDADDLDYVYPKEEGEISEGEDDETTMEVEESNPESVQDTIKMVNWKKSFCYCCGKKLNRDYTRDTIVDSADGDLSNLLFEKLPESKKKEVRREKEEKPLFTVCVHVTGSYLPVSCLDCLSFDESERKDVWLCYDFICPLCVK
jgi:hypothetical protein